MKTLKDFALPIPATGADIGFGNDDKFLPPWDLLPEEFKNSRTKWNDIFSKLFFLGPSYVWNFTPKEGIEFPAAQAHLKAVCHSWGSKHEHKEAGAAWLMSQWFEEITFSKK